MTNPFGKVENFFKALGSKIHDVLVAIFGQAAVDQVDAEVKQILADDTRQIFIDAVNFANTLTVSGPDKRNAAFTQISTDLKAAGKNFSTELINLGIELVVNLLKAKAA